MGHPDLEVRNCILTRKQERVTYTNSINPIETELEGSELLRKQSAASQENWKRNNNKQIKTDRTV